MKNNILYLLAIAFCFFVNLTGCSKIQERKAREQFVQDSIRYAEDSIKAVQERLAFVADSLENIRLDSLSQIAWGQTMFGMSYSEALGTETFKCSRQQRYKDRISLSFDDVKKLNQVLGLEYGFSDVWLSFKEGELYRVDIKSNELTYSAVTVNDINADMRTLKNSFESKYGKPVKEYGSVSSRDFTVGEENYYAQWEIKNKWISIIFGENSDRRCYYRIVIGNSDYPKKKHVDTPEEIAAKEEKMKNTEYIKNNSF